ncbi:MAG: hypothetical protein H6736_04200 [Alphaproteobacteria bacterium]|nr:hypothetical protein [Myxococcales bacterium]MCB9672251.1 hypothetical protein [Alphaproteobacteria bacterium]MCB9690996.1 hypothetical protein [Alphaproteobacteria bacterium]
MLQLALSIAMAIAPMPDLPLEAQREAAPTEAPAQLQPLELEPTFCLEARCAQV